MQLRDATFLSLRLFDIADGIDLEKSRELVAKGGTTTRRLALKREGSEYIQLSNPPLALELGPRRLALKEPVDVQVSARVYDHGAVSVILRAAVPKDIELLALIPLADELYDSDVIDQLCREEVEKLRALLVSALEDPHGWDKQEEYTVILVRDITGKPTAEQVLAEPGLARLLLGEFKEPLLSKAEERETLDQHFSYTPFDLAVIEWNSAFLYEPSGSEDIVDLLEICTAQLLELRYYDDVLDRELSRLYDVIGEKRSGSLLFSPYKQLLRELMLSLIELSEFIERIENSLKIVGDVYLARVYAAGLAQFRVRQWTEQVSRKHRLLQQTYGLLKGEVDHERALTLEIMVVVLILLEILMALASVTTH